MSRSFGIAAQGNLQIAGMVAEIAEQLGYGGVWTNDTPGGDGIEVAAAMARASGRIRIGIGALPCDRWSAPATAFRVERSGIPPDRLVIVLGAGRAPEPLRAVEQTLSALRVALGPQPLIGVAALGPAMCRLAGRIADVVLLNWSTPERIGWSRGRIHQGAAIKGKAGEGVSVSPHIAGYVRVALGEGAAATLAQEAARYEGQPHYRRHFAGMDVKPGIAAAAPSGVSAALQLYDRVLDETVVRALAAPGDIGGLRAIAEAARPPIS